MPLFTLAVFELIEKVTASSSIDATWNAFAAAGRRAGFANALGCFDFIGSSLKAALFAEAMPPGWLEEYAAGGFEAIDPLAARNRVTHAPFSWRLAEWDKSGCESVGSWRSLNRDAGLTAGLNILDRSGGHMRVLCLGGTETDIHPHDRMALHFAGLQAMYRMQELGIRPPGVQAVQNLSQRECECLQWIAAGKTDWEIGEILSISEKTVNVYVERAKHKLGVQTRSQAVVLALRAGLIHA
jgi:DNA-binding CsgD family transcriptional regulator